MTPRRAAPLLLLASLLVAAAPVQAHESVPEECPSECILVYEGTYVILPDAEARENYARYQGTPDGRDPICVQIQTSIILNNLLALDIPQILNPFAGAIGIDLNKCVVITQITNLGTFQTTIQMG